MIHHPVLAAVGAPDEAGVADARRHGELVLVEDAAGVVLAPVLGVHGVGAGELELAEAVVWVVGAGGGVDDEGLVGGRVGELFGGFVGGEADAVGGRGEDGLVAEGLEMCGVGGGREIFTCLCGRRGSSPRGWWGRR